MKSLIALLTLVVISFCGQAQDKTSLDFFKQQVNDSLFNFTTSKINSIQVVDTDSLDTIDIKRENWDTNVYNPYKNTFVKFPLQITFNDSNYSSPIRRKKVITSRYGWRRGRAHKGIDIDLITGDSVSAMFDGIVRFAKYNSGHGKTVIVRHYNGLETVYAHLSKYAVKANDTVKHGQYLGKGGASGNARGSHLHLVINYKGVAIHPEYLFDFTEDNLIKSKDIWVTRQWTRPNMHNSKRLSKMETLLSKEEAIANTKRVKTIYIVKRGDTLSKISLKNNTSIAAICRNNSIKKNGIIKIGQKLVLE